jgi:hypothetical protein
MPTTRVALGATALLLAAAGVLLWATSRIPEPRPVSTSAAPERTTAPARSTVPAVNALPSPVPAAQAVAPADIASVPGRPDPFKAFLEAHRGKAVAAPDAPSSAPLDPFQAALDAGRRPDSAPLVSPFGPAK